MNNNLPFSWHICYSQPTTYFSLSNQPKSFFQTANQTKKNSSKKKNEFPHIPNLPFPQPQQLQVTRKKRSHKRRSKARPRHKRTSCQVPLPAISWSKPQHKFGETESPSDEAWNFCLYCLLFMIFMIVECFFTKKTSSSKTVGHLYGNENSYLNLNHHFGGTWHH